MIYRTRLLIGNALCAGLMALVLVLSGCATVRPQKVGHASTDLQRMTSALPMPSEGVPSASITQPENPQGTSSQNVTFEKKTETLLPAPAETRTETVFPDGRKVTVTEIKPAGTIVTESVKQGVQQSLGGSWKDSAREIAAKLGSFKWVQGVGIFLMLAAVAMFHPVVRTVVGGGKSTQLFTGVAGLALVFGPSLVVGNEKILLVCCVGAPALVWLISRLEYKSGLVDANKNGIPDKFEPPA